MFTFILSSELFSGYTIRVSEVNDLSDICKMMKNRLIEDLTKLNLDILRQKALYLNLHIHDYDIMDVYQNPNREFYICNHCP
jgi:hypothetical protein